MKNIIGFTIGTILALAGTAASIKYGKLYFASLKK
jgi:hypothetical protein